MLWMQLTGEQMPEAIERAEGVCLLPFGVIERHGPHLPLGQDQLMATEVARRAAERAPAVVFPDFYFGQIHTARHAAGTIATPSKLLLPLLENVLDEIGRNGFTKILIVNNHGGNRCVLHYFLRALLDRPRPYVAYNCNFWELEGEAASQWDEMKETTEDEHGGETEASGALAAYPELVHMDALSDPADGHARGNLDSLGSLDHSLSWYADYPTHYCGDATKASAEKGAFLLRAWVDKVVRAIRAIKSDDVSRRLLDEFHRKADDPSGRHSA